MKLGIFCNFSYRHIGGSEIVIKNISEILYNNYNYKINIYSFSCKNPFNFNGIEYFPCKEGYNVINQINQNDHILIYSDSFWGMEAIFNNIDKIKPKITLCLVGAYYLQSYPLSLQLLKNNIDKFNLITHSSSTYDYKWGINNDLPITVIPNGVDINEFDTNYINFRDKYDIKEKNILLCVSSFFFGKNQSTIADIGQELMKKRDDFIILMAHSTIKYPYAFRFLNRCKLKFKNSGCKYLFLQDLPREDVISTYKSSDLFIFPSKKEVAPLVILESMTARLPWISMDVGNVKELCGGEIINSLKCDNKGYKIIDKNIINNYVNNIDKLLNNKELKEKYGNNGRKMIEERYNWKNIVPLYDKIFKNA